MRIKFCILLFMVFIQLLSNTTNASPKIISPSNSTTLVGLNYSFVIDTGDTNLMGWELFLGTKPGKKDISTSDWIDGSVQSYQFNNIESYGKSAFVTLWGLTDEIGWKEYESIEFKIRDRGRANKIPKKMLYVSMHYDLLLNQPIVREDIDRNRINSYIVKNSFLGGNEIVLSNVSGLANNQLITMNSTDGKFHVRKIKEIIETTVVFTPDLNSKINRNENIWDFYSDEHHANSYGLTAIADFALAVTGIVDKYQSKHVLLGDSWFAKLISYEIPSAIEKRFIDKMPEAEIINLGAGGDTCKKLLDRFDKDVVPLKPNYIWIICGTNDYIGYDITSTLDYKKNIEELIIKSNNINAVPIVFDTSVGKSGLKKISDEYTNIIREVYEEFKAH